MINYSAGGPDRPPVHQLTNEARAETKFTLVMPCKEEEDRKSTSQAGREI